MPPVPRPRWWLPANRQNHRCPSCGGSGGLHKSDAQAAHTFYKEKLDAIKENAGVSEEGLAELLEANPDAKYYAGKVHSMRFFLDSNLPQAMATADTILDGNRSPLDIVF